jgi:hypothetical protein
MTWPNKIQALRQYVEWECKDIPPDLVLAIIRHESGGNPGISAKTGCKCGPLPTAAGGEKTVCNALGLMQIIPATIDFYNMTAPDNDKATLEDMTGTDDRAIRLQIRVGCKYLAFVNYYLHQRFPETMPENSLSAAGDDQIALALTAYAVGHGATAAKMKEAKEQNYSPTFANVKRLFPTWGQNAAGKWINTPLKYASDVLTNFLANRSGSYVGTRPGDLVARAKTTISDNKGGFLALAICLTGAGWLIQRYYSRRNAGDE